MSLGALAMKARLNHDMLAVAIGGQGYFSAETLAAIGVALEIDYSHVAARYAIHRYNLAMARAAAPRLVQAAPRPREDALTSLAKDIVRQNPTSSTGLLIQYLLSAAPGVPEPMAADAINFVVKPNQRTGDYDAA